MILAVDIGNTTIALGVLKGRKVLARFAVETGWAPQLLRRSLAVILSKVTKKFPRILSVVICSVVPKKLGIVEAAIQKNFHFKPLIVGQDIRVPMVNRYRHPRQVGQDRLVGAYAAMRLYGAPAVIIDFGTAITFDVVSEKKEYLGGIIVPGIRLSAETLFQKTALLPRVKIKAPRSLIGRDTEGSILSGLFYGYGALSSGLIQMIKKTIRRRPNVVVTGGYLDLVKKFISRQIDYVDADLVFKGMALLLR